MSKNNSAIVGMGMITAVGLDAKQTAASIRAGITRFEETSIYDKMHEPIVMAVLPNEVLPPLKIEIEKTAGLTSRQSKMLRLAAPALVEVTRNLPELEKTPLYLGVPQSLPDHANPVHRVFLQHISDQADVTFNIAESVMFPKGRAAGLFALAGAMEAIATGRHPCAIVGGVDTFVDLLLLSTMDKEERILGAHIMDGFIPGEGAAFLVLSNMDRVKSHHLTPLALLTGVSIDFEQGHLYSDQSYKGNGMAGAVRKFFKTCEIQAPIKDVFNSMNGENHWAKEWSVAHIRNHTGFDPGHGFHHPADCIGDTGAASSVINICLAAIGIGKNYFRSPCLVTGSSDLGECATVGVLTF
jgi:3-oxoacyl-[acyl-carrier-protein] synthase-1